MENWKTELQHYLPSIEEFLTSVLLEESKIQIVSTASQSDKALLKRLSKKDIYLLTRDENYNTDLILVLDEQWYGLLSSIMLGIEEKTNNEITRDLLKKFSKELTATLTRIMKTRDLDPKPAEVQILTQNQLEKFLAHKEYYHAAMEIEGLADNKVRAECYFGNPDAPAEVTDAEAHENEENKIAEETEKETNNGKEPEAGRTSGSAFKPTGAKEMESMGQKEEVISGRNVEFGELNEDPSSEYPNEGGRSIEMLKDVEISVSVELGKINLPLGKVLQLAKGSVIELEKLAGEPVDILVNGRCIAHGEVVVIDEHFGVRISNLVMTRQRIAGLK